ncbi:MAG: hypothetical protein JWQ48_2377 [Conexibacter sp.]|nr:hypothetical protein [Conexibacter sp.]
MSLHRLTYVDDVDERTSRRRAGTYSTEPQPLEELLMLAHGLIGAAADVLPAKPARCGIAGGIRTVQIIPEGA